MTRITQSQLESYLWGAALLLRGYIDAGDYKQFICPLLFYKRLCDVFDEEVATALAESGGDQAYDTSQESYKDLRSIMSERSDSIVAWAGAGLCRPAGLPSWARLRQVMIEECNNICNRELDSDISEKKKRLTEQAERESNSWISFLLIAKVMGEQSCRAAIRRAFKGLDSVAVPEFYRHL